MALLFDGAGSVLLLVTSYCIATEKNQLNHWTRILVYLRLLWRIWAHLATGTWTANSFSIIRIGSSCTQGDIPRWRGTVITSRTWRAWYWPCCAVWSWIANLLSNNTTNSMSTKFKANQKDIIRNIYHISTYQISGYKQDIRITDLVSDWLIVNLGCISSWKSKIGFLNPKRSENRFCVSILDSSVQELSDHGVSKELKNPSRSGFFGSFDAPWFERSWI